MKQKQLPKSEMIIALSSLAFYLFFFFFDGVYIAADSASYITMNLSREPVYPLFLAFLRGIAGEAWYLSVAVFLQSLLAAFAAFWMTNTIRNVFRLNLVFSGFVLLIQVAITILNRFFALRSVGYENSIQTEGIAISLYIIWTAMLIRYLSDKRKINLLWIFVIAILLISTRKQMLLTLPVIAVVLFFTHCVPKFSIKKFLLIVAAVILAFGVTVLISKGYNLAFRGSFVGYTDSSNTVFTNMLYAADAADAEQIEDPALRELYESIYKTLDDKQLNYKYAPEGILNLETHYSESYDLIAITTVQPMIKQYVRDTGITDEMAVSLGADEVRTQIIKEVLADNLPQMFRVYCASVLHGFILTIAKQQPILNLYALGCYMLYGIMTILILYKKGINNTAKVALLTGFLVIANVTLTAAFIFCQTRYMIYNMALCYITALLLIKETYALIPENMLQFIKFGMVGATNTLISYSIYYIALLAGLHYQIGNFLAYVITVFISFMINGNWVFKKKDGEERGFWKPLLKVYISYGVTSLLLNAVLLYIQIDLFNMPKQIAPIINLVITIPLNFLLNKYWAFGKKVKDESSYR